MGYRIDIKDQHGNRYYGTKLYGYVDEDKLQSYQYLIKIGKFNGWSEIFVDGCDNKITLTAKEFEVFIKLYSQEWDKELDRWKPEMFGNQWIGKHLITEPEIVEMLKNTDDKIISWG